MIFFPEVSQKLDLTFRKLTPSRAARMFWNTNIFVCRTCTRYGPTSSPLILGILIIFMKHFSNSIFEHLPNMSVISPWLNAIFSRNMKSCIKGPIVWRKESLLHDSLEAVLPSSSFLMIGMVGFFVLSFLFSRIS